MTETFTATIQGNPWDLWGLSKLFDGTNADATHVHAKDPATLRLDLGKDEDKRWFDMFGHDRFADLTSNKFRVEFPFGSKDMFDLALDVIARMNAIGKLIDPDYWPVTLFDCVYVRENSTSFSLAGGSPRYKDATGLGDGRQILFAYDLYGLAGENPAIRFVVDAINLPATWASLYLIYEAIRDNVGDQQSLEQFNFVPVRDLRNFTFAANACRVVSEGIRHGSRLNFSNQPHIAFAEACQIINKLTIGWLEVWRKS
jgi:hypothetical protein